MRISERGLLLALLIILEALLLILKPDWAGRGAIEPVQMIYISTTGSDDNTGDEAHPIRTLSHADHMVGEFLKTHLAHFDILVAPGTYYGQSTSWHASHPRVQITIIAADPKMPPIFDGHKSEQSSNRLPYFFKFIPDSDLVSNIRFYSIRIRDYENGILFRQGLGAIHRPLAGRNTVIGCKFFHIGPENSTAALSSAQATFAIWMQNSGNNQISGNVFENLSATAAVGVTDYSFSNTISENRFENLQGNAIQIRNASDLNLIEFNQFEKLRVVAIQDRTPASECASWENRVTHNEFTPSVRLAENIKDILLLSPQCQVPPSFAQRLLLIDNLPNMHVVHTKSERARFIGYCASASDCAGPMGTCHANNSIHRHLYCFNNEWHRCEQASISQSVGGFTCQAHGDDFAWLGSEPRAPASASPKK